MKTIYKTLALLAAITVSIALSQCNPSDHGENSEKPDSQQPDSSQLKKAGSPGELSLQTNFVGSPISGQGYTILKDSLKRAYSLNQSGFSVIESIIPLTDFMNYLHSGASNFTCVRFYPAYENNKIFAMICLTEDKDVGKDVSFIALNKEFFAANAFKPSTFDSQTLYNAFLSNVLENGKPQVNQHLSRVYLISDFEKLQQDNQPHNPMNIKIELGYVPASVAGTLRNIHNSKNPNSAVTSDQEMMGFTTLITLIDGEGNRLLNLNDNNQNPDSYDMRALEVGTPCPPRCGIY